MVERPAISSVDWLVLIGATLALAGIAVVFLLAGCTIERAIVLNETHYCPTPTP